MGWGLSQGLGQGWMKTADIFGEIPEERRAAEKQAMLKAAELRAKAEHDLNLRKGDLEIKRTGNLIQSEQAQEQDRQRARRKEYWKGVYDANPKYVIPEERRAEVLTDLGPAAFDPTTGLFNQGIFYDPKAQAETRSLAAAAEAAEQDNRLRFALGFQKRIYETEINRNEAQTQSAQASAAAARAARRLDEANLPVAEAAAARMMEPGKQAEADIAGELADFKESKKNYEKMLATTKGQRPVGSTTTDTPYWVEQGTDPEVLEYTRKKLHEQAVYIAQLWAVSMAKHAQLPPDSPDLQLSDGTGPDRTMADRYLAALFPYRTPYERATPTPTPTATTTRPRGNPFLSDGGASRPTPSVTGATPSPRKNPFS